MESQATTEKAADADEIDFCTPLRYAPIQMERTRITVLELSRQKDQGEFARFDTLATKLLSVPHSRIKEQLDAEKQRKRTSKRASASGRASSGNR